LSSRLLVRQAETLARSDTETSDDWLPLSRVKKATGYEWPRTAQAESAMSSGWIPLVNPLQRSRVRLLREPVELFADNNGDDYPSAEFVAYKRDFEAI
jgi:hypothetical protein